MRALLILLFVGVAAMAAERPNIVLIFADDLGVNDLSCYGRADQPTPHLDRLASEGMRFTAAYCPQPICSPSRAALLTGKTPARLHLTSFLPGRADAPSQKLLQPVMEGQLPLEEVTIAEVLREVGYATACIGKWHLGGPKFGPKVQGFDTVFAGRANTTPSDTEGSKGEYELTAAAEHFMEQNRERPFFLYLSHHTPHIPFAARPQDVEKHAGAFNPTHASVIERMDECAGRIMTKLAELQLVERTILIFTSDNGGLHVLEFPLTPATHNTPYRAGKGYLYEGGLRIPLIVRWPGTVAAGAVERQPMILTDLMPTLLHAAGVDPLKTVGPLDGENVLPLWRGEAPKAKATGSDDRTFYWHFPHYTNQGGRPGGAVRDGDWKLIENYEDKSLELYDLSKDPSERNDLSTESADVATRLREQLFAWRRKVGAQENEANPDFDADAHRVLYVQNDPTTLVAAEGATAAALAEHWGPWRAAMNAATQGRKPSVKPAAGDLRLHAQDAKIHGVQLRYEPEQQKNTLGYWTKPEDWASWEVKIAAAGTYEVEVLQGCQSGGSEVEVEIARQKLNFTVQDTGHFQHFIQRAIGTVQLPEGAHVLTVKPRTKSGAAIMDLRRVVLRPINAGRS